MLENFSNETPICVKEGFLKDDLLVGARNWINKNSKSPAKSLEPEFDIADNEKKIAKKIRNLYWHDEAFWSEWLETSGIASLVREYIDDPVVIKHAAFIKRHKEESFIPLHQDSALWEKPYKTAITVWVALTDSKKNNGGMFYYPYIEKILPHEFDLRYPSFKCIPCDRLKIADEALKPIEVLSGSIVVWPANLPHGSYSNISGEFRLGMPIVFVSKLELE